MQWQQLVQLKSQRRSCTMVALLFWHQRKCISWDVLADAYFSFFSATGIFLCSKIIFLHLRTTSDCANAEEKTSKFPEWNGFGWGSYCARKLSLRSTAKSTSSSTWLGPVAFKSPPPTFRTSSIHEERQAKCLLALHLEEQSMPLLWFIKNVHGRPMVVKAPPKIKFTFKEYLTLTNTNSSCSCVAYFCRKHGFENVF